MIATIKLFGTGSCPYDNRAEKEKVGVIVNVKGEMKGSGITGATSKRTEIPFQGNKT